MHAAKNMGTVRGTESLEEGAMKKQEREIKIYDMKSHCGRLFKEKMEPMNWVYGDREEWGGE